MLRHGLDSLMPLADRCGQSITDELVPVQSRCYQLVSFAGELHKKKGVYMKRGQRIS